MLTREEAIKRLREAGLLATARDWVMGETILVHHPKTTKPAPELGPNVTTFWPLLYLVQDEGKWMVTDCGLVDEHFDDFQELILFADEFLQQQRA